MNNLSSLLHFLPELLIIQLALSTIILDLISLKKWVNISIYAGFAFIALLLYQFAPIPIDESKQIFNGMLINDSFSYYFKWIILVSTFSIIIVSNYSKELDTEYSVEFKALILFVLLGMFLMTNSIDLLIFGKLALRYFFNKYVFNCCFDGAYFSI